jgi:predicted RNase H-like nuclease (RuvC/YqgF family)
VKTFEKTASQKPRVRDRAKTKLALQRAIRRFESKGMTLSIAAIAREVGVTAPLIHNTYPLVANEINLKNNRSARQKNHVKTVALNEADERIRALTDKLKESEKNNKKLASINETLRDEIASLRAQLKGKVSVIHSASGASTS